MILDLTQVELAEAGPDRVRVTGARGRTRPATLKATVCFDGGFLAEAEISYAGPNARSRATLAIDTVMKRVARLHPAMRVRADLIGVISVFGDTAGARLKADVPNFGDSDLRVRFAAESADRTAAECLLDEVEALYCAGPAGGGGVRRRLTPRLRSASCLVDRKHVAPQVSFLEMA